MESERFKDDEERTVAVCIAVQQAGIASIEEVINKIEKQGGKITFKQAEKICKNLQAKGILSIELSAKDSKGITIPRYKMKRINFTVPEVANLHDLVNSDKVKPLIQELEKSKQANKGMKPFNYFKVEIAFKVTDGILGFIPSNGSRQEDTGTLIHYRNGDKIIFYPRHFRAWLRGNLPLVNRYGNKAESIATQMGYVDLQGKKPEMVKEEFYITNIESYGKGTGRGSKVHEKLPAGTLINTFFLVPEDEWKPEDFKKALQLFGEQGLRGFGAYSKAGWGHLSLEKFEVKGFIWD